MFAVQNFDPAEDILDFGSLSASDVTIEEAVRRSSDHGREQWRSRYLLEGLQAEDLSIANLTAANWNAVITDTGGIADQLAALGNADLLM